MKIVFGEENPAAIFGDERVSVGQLAAGIIHLEAGAAGEPDCRDAAMIEGGGELVESWNALSIGRDQVVNGDV